MLLVLIVHPLLLHAELCGGDRDDDGKEDPGGRRGEAELLELEALVVDELHDRLAHFSGRGAQAAASALRLMRHGAESRPETLLRLLLGRAGFPEPLLQAEIVDDGGHFHGFADLYYPEFKVIVEYDGDHHRTRVSQYDRDITRIDEFIASGNAVVRVRAARLFRSPSSIAPLVLRAHERQAKVMGLELPLAALRSQLKG